MILRAASSMDDLKNKRFRHCLCSLRITLIIIGFIISSRVIDITYTSIISLSSSTPVSLCPCLHLLLSVSVLSLPISICLRVAVIPVKSCHLLLYVVPIAWLWNFKSDLPSWRLWIHATLQHSGRHSQSGDHQHSGSYGHRYACGCVCMYACV